MPALAVAEGALLRANTINVIRFTNDELSSSHRIDSFFQHLANEWGDRVIAVLLSGGGTDGADGARAIAAKGGTVLVQDPATAPQPDMPRNTM